MTPQDGMSEIDATAPLAEMQRLTDLRSITGTGVFGWNSAITKRCRPT